MHLLQVLRAKLNHLPDVSHLLECLTIILGLNRDAFNVASLYFLRHFATRVSFNEHSFIASDEHTVELNMLPEIGDFCFIFLVIDNLLHINLAFVRTFCLPRSCKMGFNPPAMCDLRRLGETICARDAAQQHSINLIV